MADEDSGSLDYVVAGFGIGAILALIGFALWELFGNVEEADNTWLGRAAIGLMIGALVIWAVTGVSLISHTADATGSRLVLLTTLVTLVAIAVGTFWYWRADRAMTATRPQPARSVAARQPAAVAAAPAADIELTEWDSWPDRDAGKADGTRAEPAPIAAEAAFEPEVAAEAVASATIEELPVAEPAAHSIGPESPTVEAAADAPAPATAPPSNIRPFRAPVIPAPAAPDEFLVVAVSDEIGESVDAATVKTTDERVVAEVAVEIVEVPEPPALADAPAPVADQPPVPAVAFESSLLADVDGTLADENGSYRSPLLSDLGSDQLEGVGLAKWRNDSLLIDVTDEDAAPQPARRFRRK